MSKVENPLGIDVGTGTSEAATLDEYKQPVPIRNMENNDIVPSAVFVDDNGDLIVGEQALSEKYNHPDRVVINFKRLIGTKDVLCSFKGHDYKACDFYCAVIKDLVASAEKRLGKKIENIVLAVPANWDSVKRNEAREAAMKAGVNVLELVSEPTCAATAYGFLQHKKGRILIYDMGAGTFDNSLVCVSDGKFIVEATNGISEAGGMDMDNSLTELALNEFERQTGYRPASTTDPDIFTVLSERVVNAKHALSVLDSKKIFVPYQTKNVEIEIKRVDFENLIDPLIQKSIECCEDTLKSANLSWKDVNDIVLVGGPSKIPLIQAMIEKASGKKPKFDVDPERAVSFGTALIAAHILGNEKKQIVVSPSSKVLPPLNVEIKDVLSQSIGVIVRDISANMDYNHVLLEKNTPIPAEKEDIFGLIACDYDSVSIKIVQGAHGVALEQCRLLDEFVLEGTSASQKLDNRIKVKLSIPRSGIVEVSAIDVETNKALKGVTKYEKQ